MESLTKEEIIDEIIKNKLKTWAERWSSRSTLYERLQALKLFVNNSSVSQLSRQYMLLYFCFDKSAKITNYCLKELENQDIEPELLLMFVTNPQYMIVQNVQDNKSHKKRLISGRRVILENFSDNDVIIDIILEKEDLSFLRRYLGYFKNNEDIISYVSNKQDLKFPDKVYFLTGLGAIEELKKLMTGVDNKLNVSIFNSIKNNLTKEELFEIPKSLILATEITNVDAYILLNITPEMRENFQNNYCQKNYRCREAHRLIFEKKIYRSNTHIYRFTEEELFEIIKAMPGLNIYDYLIMIGAGEKLYLANFTNHVNHNTLAAKQWYSKFKRIYSEEELNEIKKNPLIKDSYLFLQGFSHPEKNIQMAERLLKRNSLFLFGYLLSPKFNEEFFYENSETNILKNMTIEEFTFLSMSGNLNKIPEIIENLKYQSRFLDFLPLILKSNPDDNLQQILVRKTFELKLNERYTAAIIQSCGIIALSSPYLYENAFSNPVKLYIFIGERVKELKTNGIKIPEIIINGFVGLRMAAGEQKHRDYFKRVLDVIDR